MTRDRRRGSAGAAALAVGVLVASSVAQQGDRTGETQPPLPDHLRLPPAPVVAPEAARDALVVADGFRVELVAAEPLVEDPIQIAFDADGTLWVLEMRGYMPDVDGRGERAPVGAIATLHDDDGDGRMDRRVTFVDDLVLARAIAPAYDGVLVVEPPHLVFRRDTDGDGRADERTVLLDGFAGLESPEHAGNGLVMGVDGWWHLSQHPARVWFDGTTVRTERTPGHGQWGLTRDDAGRFYYSTNSDPLRCDLVPLTYGVRHAGARSLTGVNHRIARDFSVWPIRPTPGVNRGYRDGTLRDDGTLATFTGACGQHLYRDQVLGDTVAGSAFVCEPAGNLIAWYAVHEESDATPRAEPALERQAFLASPDERFRPVNLATGPDGGLYVVDFYRGILQHRIFMTSFLRAQVLERGLDRPPGLGRIYRVVRDDAVLRTDAPALRGASIDDLITALDHPSAWWRETAQRRLLERRAELDDRAVRQLRDVARDHPRPATRLLAHWTSALAAPDDPALRDAAARDAWWAVRAAVPELAPPTHGRLARDRVVRLLGDAHPAVRRRAALALGEDPSAVALAALRRAVAGEAGRNDLRARHLEDAVINGLAGRAAPFLAQAADAPRGFTERLARAEFERGAAAPSRALLELAARGAVAAPARDAILRAAQRVARVGDAAPQPLRLDRRPFGWTALRGDPDAAGHDAALALDAVLEWPGRAAVAVQLDDLNAAQRARMVRGEMLFATHCARCHLANGAGQPGIAPRLVGTPGVHGSDDRLVRIMLHGMTGPIEVDGASFDALMPESGARDDDSIAAILTYIRRAWGNRGAPVDPARVASIRATVPQRTAPWHVDELAEIERDDVRD